MRERVRVRGNCSIMRHFSPHPTFGHLLPYGEGINVSGYFLSCFFAGAATGDAVAL